MSQAVCGGLRRSALIGFLQKRFAAGTPRFALNINSIVLPAGSTARWRYSHSLPDFTWVSSETR